MAQTFELAAFRHLLTFVAARGEQWIQGVLFRVRYALQRYARFHCIDRSFPSNENDSTPTRREAGAGSISIIINI